MIDNNAAFKITLETTILDVTFSRIDRNIKSIIINNVGFYTSQTKLNLLIFFSIIFPLLFIIIKPPVSHKQYSNF